MVLARHIPWFQNLYGFRYTKYQNLYGFIFFDDRIDL